MVNVLCGEEPRMEPFMPTTGNNKPLTWALPCKRECVVSLGQLVRRDEGGNLRVASLLGWPPPWSNGYRHGAALQSYGGLAAGEEGCSKRCGTACLFLQRPRSLTILMPPNMFTGMLEAMTGRGTARGLFQRPDPPNCCSLPAITTPSVVSDLAEPSPAGVHAWEPKTYQIQAANHCSS
jgi:hypothetical protein